MGKMSRLPSSEKGSILVWTAVGLSVLIAFAGLATDIPYLYVARQQAQTAADAGALAGAYGLFVSPDQAETDAKAFAGRNPIIGQSLTPGQVDALLQASTGGAIPDQIQCVTHRDVAHGNPMPLFLLPILQLFGLERTTVDFSATATARLVTTCGSTCFRPWSIPDRWIDVNGNGKFDSPPDIYIPPPQPGATGYAYSNANGLQVTLKVGSPGNTLTPSFFYAVDFPPLNRGTPVTGASAYEGNISTCGPQSFVAVGDQLQVEPGNMQGPTKQGIQALIDLDPNAQWDSSCTCVTGSQFGPTGSPRLIHIAFFDPRFPVISGRNYITVVNVGGFFVKSVDSQGDVVGNYTRVPSQGGTPNPACTLLSTVQLVQ